MRRLQAPYLVPFLQHNHHYWSRILLFVFLSLVSTSEGLWYCNKSAEKESIQAVFNQSMQWFPFLFCQTGALAIMLCKCPLLWSRSISLDPDSGSPCLEEKDSFTTWFRASWHSGEGLIPVLIHAAVIWFKPSWPSREVGPWPSREVGPWLRFPGSEQGDSGHTWTTAGMTSPKTPLLLCYLLGDMLLPGPLGWAVPRCTLNQVSTTKLYVQRVWHQYIQAKVPW